MFKNEYFWYSLSKNGISSGFLSQNSNQIFFYWNAPQLRRDVLLHRDPEYLCERELLPGPPLVLPERHAAGVVFRHPLVIHDQVLVREKLNWVQGDHSVCLKPPVDIDLKVEFYYKVLILKRNFHIRRFWTSWMVTLYSNSWCGSLLNTGWSITMYTTFCWTQKRSATAMPPCPHYYTGPGGPSGGGPGLGRLGFLCSTIWPTCPASLLPNSH